MSLVQVYFRQRSKKFYANRISVAAIFSILSWTINIIAPLVVVFLSDGFWIKRLTIEQQPEVNFKHQFLVILELVRPYPGRLIYSTFPGLNKLIESRLIRSPQVSNYESDHNFDGLFDDFSLQLSMPLKANEEISGFDLFLIFDYKLRSKVHFDMEAIVRTSYRSITPGCKVFVTGDLRLNQKELLRENHSGYNFSLSLDEILNSNSNHDFKHESFHEDVSPSLEKLMETYLKNNITTELAPNKYVSWSSGRDVSNDFFRLYLKLNYAVQEIAYRPGFWFVIKWAWVQYLAVFGVLYFWIEKVRSIVFDEHLVPTIQVSD